MTKKLIIKCPRCSKPMDVVREDDAYYFLMCERKHKPGIGRVDHVVLKEGKK